MSEKAERPLSHDDFCAKYKKGRVKVHVDKFMANKFVEQGLLPAGYRAARLFYAWIWILGMAGGAVIAFTYKWWVGLIVFIVATRLPEAIRMTAAQEVRDQILENEEFYTMAVKENLINIEETGEE